MKIEVYPKIYIDDFWNVFLF